MDITNNKQLFKNMIISVIAQGIVFTNKYTFNAINTENPKYI